MAHLWLRLWHDMPTDPKWRTIARVSGQPIALVQALYLHLLVDASRNVTRGHVDVTHEDLASALDVTEEQIISVIDAMQGRVLDGKKVSGWDKRQPKREDAGSAETGAKSAAQRKREQRERERASTDGQQCHDMSRDVTLDKDKDKEVNNPTSPRKRVSDDEPAGFAEFWSAYPRKVSKPQALKAWRKLSHDTQALPAILAGLERDRRSDQWLRDGGQFIPHPATWLNNRRWEDEANAWTQSAPTSRFGGSDIFAGCE